MGKAWEVETEEGAALVAAKAEVQGGKEKVVGQVEAMALLARVALR